MSDDRCQTEISLLRGVVLGRQMSDIRPLSFAGLVVLAGGLNPIPSRTRPLNSPAPMVLSLKTWKSRSLPSLRRTDYSSSRAANSQHEKRDSHASCVHRGYCARI